MRIKPHALFQSVDQLNIFDKHFLINECQVVGRINSQQDVDMGLEIQDIIRNSLQTKSQKSLKINTSPTQMIDAPHSIPIGRILFDSKITTQGRMQLVNPDIVQVLQSQTWLIKNGKYAKNNWKLIVPYIIELNIHELVFYNNPEPGILREIVGINFLQLKWLFLSEGHNRINNIEAIAWLEAPRLEKLILSNSLLAYLIQGDNEFISIKPLQKLNAPHLAELHINGNPFKKAPLDRIRMSDIVDCISLEEIQTDRIVACDLSEYAKTNIKWMDLIQIEGERRIRQQKVRMSLSRMYGMIRLSKDDKKGYHNLKNSS